MTANPPGRLEQFRETARAMLDAASPRDLARQPHVELSPLLWHVGHVFFVETYWLAERVFGATSTTDRWRSLYFPEAAPKGERAERLPDRQTLREWTFAVSRDNDRLWQLAAEIDHPLLADGYLHAFLRQHYAQHLETMRHILAQIALAGADPAAISPFASRPPECDAVTVAAHRVTLGTADIKAYDNEQPPVTVDLDSFKISRHPVSNAEWRSFIRAGGYERPELWDDDGWHWRCGSGVTQPQHWLARGSDGWLIGADDETSQRDDIGKQPLHGIGWYEARAFARYAGARLPLEAQWEAACRAGVLGDLYRVWEWCNDAFAPYPGFRAFPYAGYSRTWFDGHHFVVRGGSRHTEAEIRRPGFRNFYPPTHRHIFAGLRLVWD